MIYIVHCKHPPWAIPCHPLVLRWCGWRLAGRPWCRGPCCSAPGPPHPSCCSCPAPAPAPACYHQRGENSCTGHFAWLPVWLGTTQDWSQRSLPAAWRAPWSLRLGEGEGAIVRAVTGHPWSLDVATIACRASARCVAHVTALHSGPPTSRAAARLSAVYSWYSCTAVQCRAAGQLYTVHRQLLGRPAAIVTPAQLGQQQPATFNNIKRNNLPLYTSTSRPGLPPPPPHSHKTHWSRVRCSRCALWSRGHL